MITKVYSIYDTAAQAYMTPFYHAGKGTAFRAFQDAVLDKNSVFAKHPDDYTLFELGEFDDLTAVFKFHTAPQRLASARELVQVVQ
nr:MAG: nonstructural protein [Microviridae sp.]